MQHPLTLLLALLLLLPLRATAQDTSRERRLTYWYVEATKQKLAGHSTAYYELLRHCLRLNPDAPAPLSEMALYEYHLQHDSLGLTMLQRASRLDTLDSRLHELLSAAYIKADSMTLAAEELEKLYKLQPSRSEVLERLVDIYRYNEQPERAIDALTRLEQAEGRTNESALQKFNLYQDMGRGDEAFACIEQLCRDCPHDMSCRLLLAGLYLDADRPHDALPLYDEVRRMDPQNQELQTALLAYYRAEGPTSAYLHLRDSLLYAPGVASQLRFKVVGQLVAEADNDSTQLLAVDTIFHRILAATPSDVYMQRGYCAYLAYARHATPEQLLPTLHTILALAPDDKSATRQLLQYYIEQNDLPHIEQIAAQGIQYHPRELLFHYFLGIALYQQDRDAEAALAFETGTRHIGDSDDDNAIAADLYAALGDIYHGMGREAEAFAAYDSCLARNADNASCLNNYAYYLSLRRERLDEAERMSYRTVRLEPDNKTYLDTYAWILFEQKDYAMARSYIDRVVPPEATDSALLCDTTLSAVVIEHAGDIYSMAGQTDTALRYWSLAHELDAENALLNKKIKLKKYIRK